MTDNTTDYVIAAIDGAQKYAYYDQNGKLSCVNHVEKATKFSDAGQAYRALINHMPKKKRSGWKVVSVAYAKPLTQPQETPRYKAVLDNPYTEEFNWDAVVSNVANAFRELESYRKKVSTQLEAIEDELCDCAHACEFFKCDAARGYKLYHMIRERRIKRRFLKNELWKADTILGMSHVDIVAGKFTEVFQQIADQAYEPRVLKELFNDSEFVGGSV